MNYFYISRNENHNRIATTLIDEYFQIGNATNIYNSHLPFNQHNVR